MLVNDEVVIATDVSNSAHATCYVKVDLTTMQNELLPFTTK